ncbi:MAG TPA: helix-turn-helix domain-containing protein [Candidatus Sulfotelmatobacter sp.]|jgi:cytoskeletal protein RodZ|nr:helix-turn-helix domain-containing protein [Candidatus Sulfotelmatobacter sp.]
MVRLGQRLYQKRLQRKQSFEEIAQELKIKPTFLAAIERGEYHKLPSPAYAQGFVRNYASYLGLSKAETTVLFKREFDEKRAMKVLPDSMVKTKEFPIKRIRIQQSLIAFVFFLLILLGYLFFQYRSAILPPSLSVTSPQTGNKTSQDVIVSGTVDSNATITINGEPVTVSNNGTFQKNMTLFPGSATLLIKATNRFGKATIVQRTIEVQ